MRPSLTPLAASTCDTAPTVPDEPSASCQWRRRERLERFLELGAGGDLRLAEGALAEAAFGEILHRQADAADLERFGALRGRVPRPRIISVERPPMSTTRRGTVDGCSRATPA